MSDHPDNPWWDHERNQPIMIMTRTQWYEAREAGHLTPGHVFLRMKNIIDHATGNETSAAYDEEGFVTALTAEGLPCPGGVTMYVYSNDHPPPHVHVKLRSHPKAKLRVNLETVEFMDGTPRGLASKKLKGLQAAVRENHDILAGWWKRHHGDPVILT